MLHPRVLKNMESGKKEKGLDGLEETKMNENTSIGFCSLYQS